MTPDEREKKHVSFMRQRYQQSFNMKQRDLKQSDRQSDRQSDSQSDSQTVSQTDSQSDSQTDSTHSSCRASTFVQSQSAAVQLNPECCVVLDQTGTDHKNDNNNNNNNNNNRRCEGRTDVNRYTKVRSGPVFGEVPIQLL